MNKKLIIEKGNTLAYEYLTSGFASLGIKFKVTQSKQFYFVSCDWGEEQTEQVLRFVSKAIIIPTKFRTLLSAFEKVSLDYAGVACLSALLHFDLEGEIKQVRDVIVNKNTLSLEGIFEFCLGKMREDWEELKSIGEVLELSDNEDDIYNVTTFMMSNRGSSKSLFLAEYPEILLANVTDGHMVENFRLHQNDDFNLINLVVAESPSELIIEKNQIKQPLYECLSKLVNIKVL